jgi:hypothetical protein
MCRTFRSVFCRDESSSVVEESSSRCRLKVLSSCFPQARREDVQQISLRFLDSDNVQLLVRQSGAPIMPRGEPPCLRSLCLRLEAIIVVRIKRGMALPPGKPYWLSSPTEVIFIFKAIAKLAS